MFHLICSEMLKMKHTFSVKLVFIAPIITLALAYLLSKSSAQFAAYNWWYTMILPIMLSVLCASIIVREKKTCYQNVLCLTSSLTKVWGSKVLALGIVLFAANMIMWLGCIILGVFTTINISPINGMIGCILLTVSYLWQIPFIMILTKLLGYLPAVLISFGGNLIFSISAAEKNWFLFDLYAIPARIVCPFFGVHPNGIIIENGSYLLNTEIIIPAMIVSLASAGVLLLVTARVFTKGGKQFDRVIPVFKK